MISVAVGAAAECLCHHVDVACLFKFSHIMTFNSLNLLLPPSPHNSCRYIVSLTCLLCAACCAREPARRSRPQPLLQNLRSSRIGHPLAQLQARLLIFPRNVNTNPDSSPPQLPVHPLPPSRPSQTNRNLVLEHPPAYPNPKKSRQGQEVPLDQILLTMVTSTQSGSAGRPQPSICLHLPPFFARERRRRRLEIRRDSSRRLAKSLLTLLR